MGLNKWNVLKDSKVMENAQRLNNYMESIDNDLKAMQQAFNKNMEILANSQKELNNKLDALKQDIQHLKKK